MKKFTADRKPKLLILENVKGLLAPNPETNSTPIDFVWRGRNPDSERHCYAGMKASAEWGPEAIPDYVLRWDLLYTLAWSIPQLRPRVYIIVVRTDVGGQHTVDRIFRSLHIYGVACLSAFPQSSCCLMMTFRHRLFIQGRSCPGLRHLDWAVNHALQSQKSCTTRSALS